MCDDFGAFFLLSVKQKKVIFFKNCQRLFEKGKAF